MKPWTKHCPRLEPLESRLQPGSLLTGIPELPSSGIELPDPATDLGADLTRPLIHQRRSSGSEAAPLQPNPGTAAIIRSPGQVFIPNTSRESPTIHAPPIAANPLQSINLRAGAVRPATSGHPLALAASPATFTAARLPAVADRLPIRVTPVRPGAGRGHSPPKPGHPSAYVSYAPATNPTGPSEDQAIAAAADGTAFVTGWTVDTNGQQDLFIERTTLAGAVTSAILAAPDGSSWSGQGIVLTGSSTAGTVYVVGNAVSPNTGAGSVLVASLSAADLIVNAMMTLSGMDGSVSGRALSLDSHGDPLLTGQAANATGGQNLAVFRLDAGLTRVLNSISFHIPNFGDLGGNAITLDAADQVYIGGTLDTSPTNTTGVFMKLRADLSPLWVFNWNNVVDGRNGAINGVWVSGDFLYMTGFLAGNSGTTESHDLILAKIHTADGNPFPGGYTQRWSVGTADQSTGDFGGHALAVDAAGQAFVAADINGPPDDTGTLDINGQLVEFSSAGDQVVGSITYGNQTPGTTTPDRDYGVALQSLTPGDHVFSTGWTESDVPTTGFPITANAARATLATAGHDGWVAEAAQPLPAPP